MIGYEETDIKFLAMCRPRVRHSGEKMEAMLVCLKWFYPPFFHQFNPSFCRKTWRLLADQGSRAMNWNASDKTYPHSPWNRRLAWLPFSHWSAVPGVSTCQNLQTCKRKQYAYLDPLKTQPRLLPLSIIDSSHIPERVVNNSVPFEIIILHLSLLKSIKIVSGFNFFSNRPPYWNISAQKYIL